MHIDSLVCTICGEAGGRVQVVRGIGYRTKRVVGYDHQECQSYRREQVERAKRAQEGRAWKKLGQQLLFELDSEQDVETVLDELGIPHRTALPPTG